MAVTINFYNSYKDDLHKGTIDVTSDTLKVALVSSSYTPSAAHNFFDDITNELATTGGYTAGGATITSPTVTSGVFDAADTSWSSATFTARYGIVYKSTGTPGTSPLMFYIDFDANQSPSSQTFTITWNASGIVSIA